MVIPVAVAGTPHPGVFVLVRMLQAIGVDEAVTAQPSVEVVLKRLEEGVSRSVAGLEDVEVTEQHRGDVRASRQLLAELTYEPPLALNLVRAGIARGNVHSDDPQGAVVLQVQQCRGHPRAL